MTMTTTMTGNFSFFVRRLFRVVHVFLDQGPSANPKLELLRPARKLLSSLTLLILGCRCVERLFFAGFEPRSVSFSFARRSMSFNMQSVAAFAVLRPGTAWLTVFCHQFVDVVESGC